MFILIIQFFVSWIFVDFIGYWLHRWSHVSSSPLYKRHMTHHIKNYPARKFLSTKEYRSSGSDSLAFWFAPFFIFYCIMSLLLFQFSTATAIIIGAIPPSVLSVVIHDMTHVQNSFIWKHIRFRYLVRGHYAHHRNMRKNFGITSYIWDRIFFTFWNTSKDPTISS